jgi:ferric-dicitrate binding protein FerR (iron transport regulator)
MTTRDEDLRSLWDAAKGESPREGVRARALEAALVAAAARDEASGPASVTPLRAARSRRNVGAAVITLLAVAAALALFSSRSGLRARTGDVTAQSRTEIEIGGRAKVALEPQTHIAWSTPDDVTQTSGSAFYRVEPGATFRVHTPAGDVAVLGTCFRVKIKEGAMNLRDAKAGAVGAAAGIAAFVGVYEGKVSVTRASQTVTIVAGEAAETSDSGVRKSGDATFAERAFDDGLPADDRLDLDPTVAANKNLVASVSDYRARLERMEIERRALEQQLTEAKAHIEAADAAAGPPKKEITEDEWKELAKTGTVKMNVPCSWKGGWYPSAKQLSDLGLSPSDGPVLRDASKRLYDRSWAFVQPICERYGGKEIAQKLGVDGCPNFVFNMMRGTDPETTWEAMRRVSEMRAGLRPMVALDDPSIGDVERIFLWMTGEQKTLEDDIAQSFGPDEAHRLVTAESFCSWNATWNGPGPRKPQRP